MYLGKRVRLCSGSPVRGTPICCESTSPACKNQARVPAPSLWNTSHQNLTSLRVRLDVCMHYDQGSLPDANEAKRFKEENSLAGRRSVAEQHPVVSVKLLRRTRATRSVYRRIAGGPGLTSLWTCRPVRASRSRDDFVRWKSVNASREGHGATH